MVDDIEQRIKNIKRFPCNFIVSCSKELIEEERGTMIRNIKFYFILKRYVILYTD